MYQLQCSFRVNPFAQFAQNDFHGAPTRDQDRLMRHVFDALHKGIFYNSDMYDFITQEMKDVLPEDNFIDAEYLQKNIRTEHGPFGTDIYKCRNAVECIIEGTNNRQSLEALIRDGKITIGKAIKGKINIGGKNFSSIYPASINKESGTVHFHATGRGHKHVYQFTIGANDTRLLKMITSKVKDKVLQTTLTDYGSITNIDCTANRHQEMAAQYI
tara:strand:+ start:2610 stop:3254 length:645 start_codon:yes stop_codon:yes gene_type:complete